jgi:hypothetical protein
MSVEILLVLTPDVSAVFRGAAASTQAESELDAVCDVLKNHYAGITPVTPMGGTFPAPKDKQVADSCLYKVSAEDTAQAETIVKELKALPGVKSVGIKPPAAMPC